MSYSTDREAFEALLAAASTPLNPMGGDGIDRCRLCNEPIRAHAAHCLLPGLQDREQKLLVHAADFDDLAAPHTEPTTQRRTGHTDDTGYGMRDA